MYQPCPPKTPRDVRWIVVDSYFEHAHDALLETDVSAPLDHAPSTQEAPRPGATPGPEMEDVND